MTNRTLRLNAYYRKDCLSMADSVEYPDLVIVGAGLFGLTVAQQAVEHTGARVRIIAV